MQSVIHTFTLSRRLCALTMVLNATRILLLLALLPVKDSMLIRAVCKNYFLEEEKNIITLFVSGTLCLKTNKEIGKI